jgi:hypothetical protein
VLALKMGALNVLSLNVAVYKNVSTAIKDKLLHYLQFTLYG